MDKTDPNQNSGHSANAWSVILWSKNPDFSKVKSHKPAFMKNVVDLRYWPRVGLMECILNEQNSYSPVMMISEKWHMIRALKGDRPFDFARRYSYTLIVLVCCVVALIILRMQFAVNIEKG